MTSKITSPRPAEAKEYMQQCFGSLVIKEIAEVDLDYYPAIYTMLYGADEIAKHYGVLVQISIKETATEIYPVLTGRPDVIEEQKKQVERFTADPERVGMDILDALDHPRPGTPTPDHKARMATIRTILTGRYHPVPGTLESATWISDYVSRSRSGDLTEDNGEAFETIYGDRADACEVAPNSGLEDINFMDEGEAERPFLASDIVDPDRRKLAMALQERMQATVH